MSVESTILRYFGRLEADKYHRYRSWEHCYNYFRGRSRQWLAKHADEAAIHLGFYLASWGMYRGRSFLLQRDYTVHCGAIECLADPRWATLWADEFGADEGDDAKASDVVELRQCIGETYRAHGVPTDTLVTKILLGTLCCSPATDRYFLAGFANDGHSYSYFNRRFVTRVLRFCRDNLAELRRTQVKVEKSLDAPYPLMKLVDMYFFQTGLELGG